MEEKLALQKEAERRERTAMLEKFGKLHERERRQQVEETKRVQAAMIEQIRENEEMRRRIEEQARN